jgi:hypothetical protein
MRRRSRGATGAMQSFKSTAGVKRSWCGVTERNRARDEERATWCVRRVVPHGRTRACGGEAKKVTGREKRAERGESVQNKTR